MKQILRSGIFCLFISIAAASGQDRPFPQTADDGPPERTALLDGRPSLPEPEYSPPRFSSNPIAARDLIAYAEQFLERHPEAKEAPRSALDVFMAATVHNQKPKAEKALAALVFDYPQSLATAFVLANYQQNHSAYRTFLQKQFQQRAKPLTRRFAQQFAEAVSLGLDRWKIDFLGDSEFLLTAALAAHEGEVFNLELICRDRLRQAKEPTKAVANIAFDTQTTSADKVLQLHACQDVQAAKDFARYFLDRLTEAELENHEIQAVLIEIALENRKFEAALPKVNRLLAKEPQAKAYFWKGWCELNLDRPSDAASTFETLQREFPENAYREVADALQGAVLNREQTLEELASIFHRIVTDLQKHGFEADLEEGIENRRRVELEARFSPEKGVPFMVYFNWDEQQAESFELAIHKGDTLVLACKNMGGAFQLLLDGDAAIHKFHRLGNTLSPRFMLAPTPDGGFNFNWGLNVSSSGRNVKHALQEFISSPFFSTPAGLKRLLKSFLRGGWLPLAPEKIGDENIYRWIAPDIREPKLSHLEVRFSQANQRISVTGPRFAITKLRYGTSESMELTPPTWPKLPIIEKEKADPSVIFRILSAAAGLFTEE